jgi:hypothetical protein
MHHVWPFELGAGLAVAIAFASTAHIPRKQNKSGATASLTSPSQRAPNFIFVARPNVGGGNFSHLDLISDVLPFGKLGYGKPNAISNPIGSPMQPQNT